MIKRLFMIQSLLLLFTFVAAQTSSHTVNDGFTITGDIKGLRGDKVYLSYTIPQRDQASIMVKDSALLYNGSFMFTGNIPMPKYCTLRNGDGSFVYMFWLENNPIYIKGNVAIGIKTKGSKTEDEYTLFRKETELTDINKEVLKIRELLKKANDQDNQTEIQRLTKKEEKIVTAFYARCENFIERHPDSYYSLNEVYNRAVVNKYEYEPLKRLYDYLDNDIKESPNGKYLQERLDKLYKTTLGQYFPEYSQPDLNGKVINVSDYKGKYLMLTFSGSWNATYREENKRKLEYYNRYHQQGFEILDILFDNKKDKIKELIEEDHINWVVASDLLGWNTSAVKEFIIESISRTYLIDPQGKIIAVNVYGDKLDKKLNEIFK